MNTRKEKQTIIQKPKFLFNYDLDFLDTNLIKFLKEHSLKSSTPKFDSLLVRLNCFLALKKTKLNKIKFLNVNKKNNILSQFVYFLDCNGFNESNSTTYKIKNTFINIINSILKDNKSFNGFNSDVDFCYEDLDLEQIEVFNGWNIPVKSKTVVIKLYPFYKVNGIEETRRIFSKIKRFASSPDNGSFPNSSSSFNKFIDYILKNDTHYKNNDYDSLIKGFMKEYFLYADNNDISLQNRKSSWNAFIKLASYVFDIPKDLIFVMKIGQRNSFNNHISIKNNKQIKEKLITDIPLEICDDEAIKVLIDKINDDIRIVNDWAEHTISEYIDLSKENNISLDDYGLSTKELAIKKFGKYDRIKTSDIYNKDSIFNKNVLMALLYQLILEHPQITESFLLNCDLYNNNDNIFCIKETDSGLFLVSSKPRKGTKLAEQKILLNEKSIFIIELIIKSTKIMREYLKLNKNEDYKKLIIFPSNNLNPKAPKTLSNTGATIRDLDRSMINYLVEHKNISKSNAIEFSKKISLTKIRASRATQVYLETESTTKMAEALGHTKYNPNLLGHYLPAPILDFFQRRWISLFQKGIICEAMKDSDFLLKASGFKDMEKLDLFLKNHTLKNIPNTETNLKEKDTDTKDVYISVDKENVSALLSISKAVEESKNKHNITTKAMYWHNFSKKLISEIELNDSHISLRKIVSDARNEVNSSIFKDIIYV